MDASCIRSIREILGRVLSETPSFLAGSPAQRRERLAEAPRFDGYMLGAPHNHKGEGPMRAFVRAAALAVLVVAGAAAGWAADADVGLGTWKLNQEKSKFAGAAPKSLTTTFEASAKNGVKWRSDRVGADGKTQTAQYTGHYDGKDYPLTGSPTADAVSLRRIDARTTERTNKKGGKVVSVETRTVASDGKSYTTKVKAMNEKGEATETVMVFDKQ